MKTFSTPTVIQHQTTDKLSVQFSLVLGNIIYVNIFLENEHSSSAEKISSIFILILSLTTEKLSVQLSLVLGKIIYYVDI